MMFMSNCAEKPGTTVFNLDTLSCEHESINFYDCSSALVELMKSLCCLFIRDKINVVIVTENEEEMYVYKRSRTYGCRYHP